MIMSLTKMEEEGCVEFALRIWAIGERTAITDVQKTVTVDIAEVARPKPPVSSDGLRGRR